MEEQEAGRARWQQVGSEGAPEPSAFPAAGVQPLLQRLVSSRAGSRACAVAPCPLSSAGLPAPKCRRLPAVLRGCKEMKMPAARVWSSCGGAARRQLGARQRVRRPGVWPSLCHVTAVFPWAGCFPGVSRQGDGIVLRAVPLEKGWLGKRGEPAPQMPSAPNSPCSHTTG